LSGKPEKPRYTGKFDICKGHDGDTFCPGKLFTANFAFGLCQCLVVLGVLVHYTVENMT